MEFKYSKNFRPFSLRSKENRYVMVEFLVFEILLFLIEFYFNKAFFWLDSHIYFAYYISHRTFVFSPHMVQAFSYDNSHCGVLFLFLCVFSPPSLFNSHLLCLGLWKGKGQMGWVKGTSESQFLISCGLGLAALL